VTGKQLSVVSRWIDARLTVLSVRVLRNVFVCALGVRLVAALAIRLVSNGSLYNDDAYYVDSLRSYAESEGALRPGIWFTHPTFFRPLAILARWVTTDPLLPQAMSAVAGSLSVVLVAAVVRRLTNERQALLAGLTIALWPSHVIWSSLVLRDAFVWLGVCGVFAAISYGWARNHTRKGVQLFLATVIIVALAYVEGNRRHSAFALMFALSIAAFVGLRLWSTRIAALLGLIAIPFFVGLGWLGVDLWRNGSENFAPARAAEVANAETPIECWQLPLVGRGDESGGGWGNDLRCLPTTAVGLLLMPTPQQVSSNPSLLPPLVEGVGWIALYLAVIRQVRHRLGGNPVLRVVTAYVVLTIFMWSLIDRVVGTAFRHRSELLAGLVILAFSQRSATRGVEDGINDDKAHHNDRPC
jgi:hypothetical protein